MPSSRSEIVSKSREYLGVRWRHQGRLKSKGPSGGVDCAGLIIKVAHELGIFDYDFTNYERQGEWSDFIGHFRNVMDEIKIVDIKPGSVLILRERSYPCHCGIATDWEPGNKSFIHGFALAHCVVEQEYDEEWRGLTVAAFDYRGVLED